MVYKWAANAPAGKVKAQDAGEELERIQAKNGAVTAEAVLEESRPVTAVLHPCFEWDDSAAAEKYRLYQAGQIINHITIVREDIGKEPMQVRAYLRTEPKSFEPIEVIMSDEDKRSVVLDTAIRELQAFERKYSNLVELSAVFDAIDDLTV